MRSHHTSVSHFTEDEIVRLIWTLENTAEPVEIVQKHRPLSVDPGDDHILELAINGSANIIVTTNLRHIREAALQYNIQAIDPRTLLTKIGTGGS
jgi:predicted nucleic acid-binding protein